MAGKNINIVSKTLAESYIRKQIKALKQDPAQTIHTLTKQLLEKPDSPLEKYLLHITPEKLQDTQSGYYQLFHDILPKINTEHLVTFAMNIGYNGIFTASKNTQTNSPESKSDALWAFMLSIDGINYEKKSAQYKAQISNAKKNGTRCFMLFIEKNAWKLLPLIKKEKDCAFFLFCPSSCLTEKFLDAVKLTKNLFISVAYNKNNVFTYLGDKRNSGIEDATIVATHLMLAAYNEGVDSCWINFFNPDELAKAFNLPEDEEILMLLDLGVADKTTTPLPNHNSRKALTETVSFI